MIRRTAHHHRTEPKPIPESRSTTGLIRDRRNPLPSSTYVVWFRVAVYMAQEP